VRTQRLRKGQERVIAGRVRPAARLASAAFLSIAAHIAALGVFGHLRPLPSPGPDDVTVVDLSGALDSDSSNIRNVAPGDPLGPHAERRPASPPSGLAEEPGPADEIQPVPPPGPLAGKDTEPAIAGSTVVAAREAQAILEGQVESLTAERTELAARLATEHERAVRLEQRLRDLEAQREAELAAVRATYERLVEALRGEIAEKEVALRDGTDRLSVSIMDRVLFPTGQAALTPAGQRVMDKVSAVLAGMGDQRVLIEGHTDNVPIGPELRERFPSNWELSTARATEVVKYLAAHGVPGENVTAAGRADTVPIASNQSEAGRRQNRRIEIILLPTEDRPSGATPASRVPSPREAPGDTTRRR
jgi:chemotaxis protein MotB